MASVPMVLSAWASPASVWNASERSNGIPFCSFIITVQRPREAKSLV